MSKRGNLMSLQKLVNMHKEYYKKIMQQCKIKKQFYYHIPKINYAINIIKTKYVCANEIRTHKMKDRLCTNYVGS